MDGEVLEQIYKEDLDKQIISYLAKVKNISLEDAMSLYYNNDLSEKIAQGYEGIQYLEYKNLADILLEKINKSSS